MRLTPFERARRRRSGRRVIYTAIIGGVDRLQPPAKKHRGWDYVCFSDQPEITCRPWNVLPVPPEYSETSAIRTARRLKVLAHRLFPSAEVSLWLDGNLALNANVNKLVTHYLRRTDLAAHPHPLRDCTFEEGSAVLIGEADLPQVVLPQMVRYAHAGLPEHFGLIATGALLRRHTTLTASFEEIWWSEIEAGSHRDQLSVMFALRSSGLEVERFESHCWEGPLFKWRPHDGDDSPATNVPTAETD